MSMCLRCQLAPSTVSVAPLMYAANGDERNVVAQPISRGCPTRPAGERSSSAEPRPGTALMFAVSSTCGTKPGTTQLTRMPYGAHSTASVSVRFFTPALAALECAKPGPPVHEYAAPMLTMEPGVFAAM